MYFPGYNKIKIIIVNYNLYPVFYFQGSSRSIFLTTTVPNWNIKPFYFDQIFKQQKFKTYNLPITYELTQNMVGIRTWNNRIYQ